MDDPNCPVLAAAVAFRDDTGRVVTATALTDRLDREEAAIADRLERLVDCELLAPMEGGFRPTVTGREFLDLDVECGPLIVDVDYE
ncbi:hypothetical protein [Halorhabdus salina]|uniref:hypothetical protein n=1 Tax=Halorhabdus salina TaxID=2750670 RepID=UPI0015EF164F|nr:hypothetical protein [Halorhabdus salina]